VLASLKAKTDEQREFVKLQAKYAKVSAALSKSLEFFAGVCASMRTFVATESVPHETHRLASMRGGSSQDGKTRGVQFRTWPGVQEVVRGKGVMVELTAPGWSSG